MRQACQTRARVASAISRKRCFFCLGDRPDLTGELSDMIVLFVSEDAQSVREALAEFEAYEKSTSERMRLNAIVRSDSETYFESIK